MPGPRWYATDYPYAGGWLITVGAPWEPGHPERIIGTARTEAVAKRIVNDHNRSSGFVSGEQASKAVRTSTAATVGAAQLSLLAQEGRRGDT